MNSKVYVVQESQGRNLLPAQEYGDINVLLPPGNVAFSSSPTVRRLRNGLKDFTDSDYLLLMGDPAAIAMAGAIATEQNRGRMQLLKWDRQEHRYFVIKVDIHGGSV
tara:strand:+ start:3302 stop:3622 length:321 start_codon:yes stop_codon:yes gene_type:complete